MMKSNSNSYRDVILRKIKDNSRPICIFWFLMFLWHTPLGAQPETIMSPLEHVVYDKVKREALFNQLEVSQSQAGAFWKIYENYETVRRDLLKDRLELVNKLAEERSTATPENKARRIMKRLLRNDVDYRELYESYFARVAPIIGARKSLQFIHIEEYFQLRLNARLDSIILKQDYLIASKGGAKKFSGADE